MENIKFVRDCMVFSDRVKKLFAGNYIMFPMKNGNVAKACCEANGVRVEIINKNEGVVDRTLFPFANYFTKKKCSPGAPAWDQHIENGRWYFDNYPHCRPTNQDYMAISAAVDEYIAVMEE